MLPKMQVWKELIGMEWITTAATNVLSIFDSLLDAISKNSVLGMIFVGGTLIPIGFGILSRFKNS